MIDDFCVKFMPKYIFNILKNKLNLSHPRHGNIFNFIGHILSTLVDYQFLCKKPKIKIDWSLINLNKA